MSTDINDALGVSSTPRQPDPAAQSGKYSSLKSIAGIIAVFAWISGAIIMIVGMASIANISRGNAGQAILIFIAYLLMGVFIVISLLAQSGIIKVLVDIEENTRKANSK
jgi:hypothetical protein